MKLHEGILTFEETSDTPDEVDQIAWLTPDEAEVRLNYPSERALMRREANRLRVKLGSGSEG